MNSNYYCGCYGSNQGSCSYPYSGAGKITCTARGPFVAVDAACITSSPQPATIAGSLIPFASGVVPVVLTTILGGLVSTPAFVGFGTNILSPTVLGNTIDLSGLFNEAFVVPRAGNLTAISASFTITAALTLLGSATIHAEIYKAPAGSSTFTPTGARVDLLPTIDLLSIGDIAYGDASNFPPVPLAVGDRLLMVLSSTATGLDLAGAITGTVSAGINIE